MEAWSADASRFGIDYRHPLLDRRVLEVALAAPSEAFLHDGVSRWLFREATGPYLPAAVAWRPDKNDSWTQRALFAYGMATRHGSHGRWVLAEAERMLAEGDGLGGVVDLAKLRRSISLEPSRYARSELGARAPLIGVAAAVQLRAFVAHNKMSVG